MNNTVYYVVIFALFIAIFYFMGIRPQQKQRRAHQDLMSTLKKGDQIMTTTGIYGTVKRVDETVVVIEIAKGVSMKVARGAIGTIIRDSAQARAVAPEGTSAGGGRKGGRSLESSYDDAETTDNDLGADDAQEESDEESKK